MAKHTELQYKYVRTSGKILHDTFKVLEKHLLPGVTTMELDKIAEDYIMSKGGEPAFKGHQGYKYTICASVNEESIHGMPSKSKSLNTGDIISLDIGVRYPKGDRLSMCTDAARTMPVGEISKEATDLINITRQSFDVGVKGLKAGDKVKTIGQRIEKFVNGRYGIIDNYFGHGIGQTIHEGVLIPNFDVDKKNLSARVVELTNMSVQEGDIICIEPMLNCGTKDVRVAKDGWTVITADGKLAAHHENTLIITKSGVEIIT
ncbi:MAG: type I methionyl aminopeptidase [Christensenellaceae bacterium]|jgi:methionyl aminopeptidase|nr:type I methionyl aminopeptidase [Christensenellaceae bacterium]